MSETTNNNVDVPAWDVALEALAREEYDRKGQPLYIGDFQRLAVAYRFRLDDIIFTLLELCIHGVWGYRDTNGVEQEITPDTLTRLSGSGRINDDDLKEFAGGWYPLKQGVGEGGGEAASGDGSQQGV